MKGIFRKAEAFILAVFTLAIFTAGVLHGGELFESFDVRGHEIPVRLWQDTDLRELGVIHERGWTVYRIDTLVTGADGALYLGESLRISHLIRIRDIKYISVIGA